MAEDTGQIIVIPTPAPAQARAKRPSRAPFGIKGFDVAKFLISMASAVVVAYFGMKFAIERNTAAIEMNGAGIDEAHDRLDVAGEKASEHVEGEHGAVEVRLQKVERTTDRIEVKQEQTLEAIRDLKVDLRENRRRDRRSR